MLALFVSRATVLSLVVALVPLGKNIQYFLNDDDHFLEECTHNIFLNKEHALIQYPCLYLDLWMEYNGGDVYDTKKVLDTFCVITILCITLYILTSLPAVYGMVNEKECTLIPWIIVNGTISIFLLMLMSSEVNVHGENFWPSENFLINLFSVFYLTFNWIVGAIIISKIKRYPKRTNDDCSQITYLELQNLN